MMVAMPARETHLRKEHGDQDKQGSWMTLRGPQGETAKPRSHGRGWWLHWKVAGRISGQPRGPLRTAFFSTPALCAGGGAGSRAPVSPLSTALSSDWSTLCPGCAPHSLLVMSLLSKMGPRLVQACAHVLCISSSDKASVCGSRVGWGLAPYRVLFTRHCMPRGWDGGHAACRRWALRQGL